MSTRRKSNRKRVIKIPNEYLTALERGKTLFPYFYEFENGLRLVVSDFLATCYTDWWEQSLKAKLPGVYAYAEEQAENRNSMPWIGDSKEVEIQPIHLVTLGHLEEIVKKYQSDCIPELFPTLHFFLGHMDVIKKVRNYYAHMFPCITTQDCQIASREIRTLGLHINSRLASLK